MNACEGKRSDQLGKIDCTIIIACALCSSRIGPLL